MYGDPGYHGFLDWLTQGALYATPGKPVFDTEYGWVVPPNGINYGLVSQVAAGKYSLEMVFDGQRQHHVAYLRYGLYDDNAGGFGIFDKSGSPRPEAVYLHNLSVILSDTASSARTFSPGKLNVSFAGMPASATGQDGGQFLVMQRASDGHYMVEAGNEVSLETATGTPTDASVANEPVTMNFGSTMTTVNE